MVKGKTRTMFPDFSTDWKTADSSQTFEFQSIQENDLVVALDGGFTDNFATSFVQVLVNIGMKFMTYFRAGADTYDTKIRELKKVIRNVVSEYVEIMSDKSNYAQVWNYVINGKQLTSKSKMTAKITSLKDCCVRDFYDVQSKAMREDDTPPCIRKYVSQALKFKDASGNDVELDKNAATSKAQQFELFTEAQQDYNGEVMVRVFQHARRVVNDHLEKQQKATFEDSSTPKPIFLNYKLIHTWKKLKTVPKNTMKSIKEDDIGNYSVYPQYFKNEVFQLSVFANILRSGEKAPLDVVCTDPPKQASSVGFPNNLLEVMTKGGLTDRKDQKGLKADALQEIIRLIDRSPTSKPKNVKLEAI